jgi:hypothetical protein
MQLSDIGARHQTISEQWPAVKAKLDAGVPAMLGVVTVASANPMLLGPNHQLVAYAYTIAEREVTLGVYDPNSGPDDNIWIQWNTAGSTAFAHNLGLSRPVRGFFVTTYSPVQPPTG